MSAHAGSVKKIVHPDGTVEFTNVGTGGQKARGSSKDEIVYRYQDRDGVVSYSGVRPADADYEVIRFQCYACDPDSPVDWHNTPLFANRFTDIINAAANRFDLDPALVQAVIHAESAFNPAAVSPKGAQGLMQLMPATARELNVANALDARQNILGGANYLARMLQRFDGDTSLATAAYNAGPGTVGRYGGIPPYAETKAYVKRVSILRDRYASL
jgi:soluble lytic murein transglycosylase-like protein